MSKAGRGKIAKLDDLRRLFAYDDWANREALASLESAGSRPPRSLKLLGHIIGAEWLWLGRLKREKRPAVVWPELALAECAPQLARLRHRWHGYFEGLAKPKLAEQIAYVNSKGESWANTVAEILTHVVFHSAYHRGQIAADLRAAGHIPAYTDFIHAVRQRLIE